MTGWEIGTSSPLEAPEGWWFLENETTVTAFNRPERFLYDGVRRIQEIITNPVVALNSDGDVPTMGQEMWQIDPQDADQYIFLRTQYVWGPGDSPTNGVDELLCLIQGNSPSEVSFGTNNKKWYVLADAQGDVASLVHVPTANAAAQVAGQWTYSPYGEVLTCDQLSAHPAVVFGHKTLAVDRLDAPAVSWDEEQWPFSDTKRLIPGADLLTYARNRSGRPKLGRWMQNDPNQSGLLVQADLGFHGATPAIGTLALSMQSRASDGLSLYGYTGGNPVANSDPSGLFFSLPGMMMSGLDAMDNVSSQFDEALSGLRTAFGLSAMLDSYQFNQEMAMDFALDWNSSDDLLNKINTSGRRPWCSWKRRPRARRRWRRGWRRD